MFPLNIYDGSVSCHPARPRLALAVMFLIACWMLPRTPQEMTAYAQEIRHNEEQPTPVRYEVESIAFEGNHIATQTELMTQIMTRETPGWLGKFLFNSISERLGRKNEYYDPVTFSSDVERLKKYYLNRGFNEAVIDTQLRFDLTKQMVDVLFKIAEGRQSLIDTIEYRGINPDPWSIQ